MSWLVLACWPDPRFCFWHCYGELVSSLVAVNSVMEWNPTLQIQIQANFHGRSSYPPWKVICPDFLQALTSSCQDLSREYIGRMYLDIRCCTSTRKFKIQGLKTIERKIFKKQALLFSVSWTTAAKITLSCCRHFLVYMHMLQLDSYASKLGCSVLTILLNLWNP